MIRKTSFHQIKADQQKDEKKSLNFFGAPTWLKWLSPPYMMQQGNIHGATLLNATTLHTTYIFVFDKRIIFRR